MGIFLTSVLSAKATGPYDSYAILHEKDSAIVENFAIWYKVDSITIYAWSSPEGRYSWNKYLSKERAKSAKKFLLRHSPDSAKLNAGKIHISPIAENWQGLVRLVEENYVRADREQVLDILYDQDITDQVRKDPTAGPMSAYYDISDMRTNKYYTMDGPRNENAEVYMIGAAPTIEHSVQNPIVILSSSDVSPVYYNDWLCQKNDDLWGTVSKKKTIYDPCPYGYKVPDGELKKLFEGEGWEFGGNGASYSNGSTYLFFPYAGWKGDDVKRVSRTHAWMKVGIAGDYQDATFDPKTFHRGRSLLARENFNVTIYGSNQNTYRKGLNYGYTNRTAATTVRCVRYEGEPLRPDDPIGARLD